MAYIDDFGCKYSDDKKKFVRCPQDYKGHYTIAEGVTSIGSHAFERCSGLTSITIPNSVTSIGDKAFEDCRGLTSVTIPNSVTSIGYEAFSGCSGLTSVTIPNSITSIDNYAFSGCSGLTSVVWNAKNCLDFEDFFHECGDGFDYYCYAPFYYIASQITSFTFGNEVEHVPAYLCCRMANLTSITIPNSVTSIGRSAFKGCSGLRSITIPNSVTSIGDRAFWYCSGLTSVTIQNSVTSIGDGAFKDTAWLSNQPDGVIYINQSLYTYKGDMPADTSIVVREGTTQICGSAFWYCSGLTSVTIPNSVTSIGDEAFRGCSSLTSITIPNSVTSIGDYAFYDCSGLTSVTIGNSVMRIGDHAFKDTAWLANRQEGVVYINQSLYTYKGEMPVNTSIVVRNGTTQICGGAFEDCSGLISITIPDSVMSIGSSAFAWCSGLTSMVVASGNSKYDSRDNCNAIIETATNTLIAGCQLTIIPDSVTSIGAYAFSGCSGLTSVTIPNSVTSIGDEAFSGCSGLTSVVWNAKNCVIVADDAPIILPDLPFYDIASQITSFTFGNEVEHIPACLCYGMSNLTSITIPSSVTSIGKYAFEGCSGLTSITIPNSVTSIGKEAFEKCDALQTIFVPVGQKARFAAMGLPAAKIVERNNEKLQQLLTLAQVYEAGVIEPKDMAKAVRYYEGAIEEGSAEAAYHLGELYRNGKEVAADLQLAVNYFRTAADKHYKDAAQQLAACCEALERYNRQMEQFMHADEPQAEPYYLFFDTETNGLPRNYQAPISATDNWPRLIQIGWIVTDAEGNELQAGNHLVYPDGFTIPSDVERLTGISYSRARSEGKDLKEVLTEFMQQFNAVKHIVGHNIDFDLHIVGAELYRKNMPVNTILSKPYTCTMRSTIDFCQLPPFTYGSWKFPKLQELYHKLFGTQFEQAHDAMNDIRATQKCFFELKKRGII